MPETSSVKIPLDVISKYNALVSESLGSSSVYIRAKETVQELTADGSLDDVQKAAIIGDVIGKAVGSITNASMSTALEWAKYEKDLSLKKLEMDQQLLIMTQDRLLKEAQVAQVDSQTRLALVESRRMFGTGTFDGSSGALLSLSEAGKVWNDMQLVLQQTTNAGEEETLLKSKIEESKVAIHKVVADTYRNFGNYTFTLAASGGISNVNREDIGESTLSDTQQNIAVQQGKGYTYNAWANALTGSASILGTAIASGDFNFSDGSSGDHLLRTVLNCANNLATSSGSDTDADSVPLVSLLPYTGSES
jgi:hypothetical protein